MEDGEELDGIEERLQGDSISSSENSYSKITYVHTNVDYTRKLLWVPTDTIFIHEMNSLQLNPIPVFGNYNKVSVMDQGP